MAAELVPVLAGAGMGFFGALCGVYLGHRFTAKRDAVTRSIAGLAAIVAELGRLHRLELHFTQEINTALSDEGDLDKAFHAVIRTDSWTKATREVQETHWLFPCLAYMPEAEPDFWEMHDALRYAMSPELGDPNDPTDKTRDEAFDRFKEAHQRIQARVEVRLRQLLPKGA